MALSKELFPKQGPENINHKEEKVNQRNLFILIENTP